jgi:GNAT superfamily N-acetyltransferase
MTDLHFRALPPQLKPLADKFYRAHRSPMRAGQADQLWVAQQGEIAAALCLRPVAGGQWLTSLLVAPAMRRQGLARQLIEQALGSYGGPVWLFCQPQLQAFYQRLGFTDCPLLPTPLAERLARYRRSKSLLGMVREGRASPANWPTRAPLSE